MDKLQAKNTAIYRTDEIGTVVCTSDGKNISFSCSPGDYKYGSEAKTASNSSSNNTSSSSSTQSKSATVAPAPALSQQPSTTDNNRIVYWTPSGKSYHYDRTTIDIKRIKLLREAKEGMH